MVRVLLAAWCENEPRDRKDVLELLYHDIFTLAKHIKISDGNKMSGQQSAFFFDREKFVEIHRVQKLRRVR
jgi:hypothetical protein